MRAQRCSIARIAVRLFEEAMRRYGLKYHASRWLLVLRAAEIKDLISYLKFI